MLTQETVGQILGIKPATITWLKSFAPKPLTLRQKVQIAVADFVSLLPYNTARVLCTPISWLVCGLAFGVRDAWKKAVEQHGEE